MQTTAFALLYIHNLVIISYRLPSGTQFAIALHILILIVFFYMRSKNSISFLLECFKRSFATKSRLSSHENTKLSSKQFVKRYIEGQRWTEDKSWKNIFKIMLENWTSSRKKEKNEIEIKDHAIEICLMVLILLWKEENFDCSFVFRW